MLPNPTPSEIAKSMQEISKKRDPERVHGEADDLMVLVLRALGYDEAMDIYENMTKWYS